jgi:hypothetical protein
MYHIHQIVLLCCCRSLLFLLDKIQKTAYILVILLFRSKNLKTQKTNGVPRHKQNYVQSNTIDLADAEKSHYILFAMTFNIEKKQFI